LSTVEANMSQQTPQAQALGRGVTEVSGEASTWSSLRTKDASP
jgi:hypothetical protein